MVLSACGDGHHVAGAHLRRVSPCEHAHAILFRVAQRTEDCAPPAELAYWLRLLLSFSVVFMNLQGEDAQYAEANNLREDAAGAARASVLTSRQLVYSIQGLKTMEENTTKTRNEVREKYT